MARVRALRSTVSSHEVRDALAAFGRARRLQAVPGRAVRGFVAGVGLGALALGLQVALARLLAPRWIAVDRLWLLALPVALALLAALTVLLRRSAARRVARETDVRLELAERVSTALEIEERPGRTDGSLFASLQRADALAQLRRFEPFEVFPARLTRRETIALVGALAVLLALVALPDVTGASDRRSLARDVARAEAERLTAVADELASAEDLPAEERGALSQALTQAAQELRQGAETPDQAMAALSQAEQSLSASPQSGAAADRELALARLADALDQTAAGREAASRLDRRDYAGAAQEIQRLGRESTRLSPEDQRALSEALQRAAANTSRLDPALGERLSDAASALSRDAASQGGGEQSQSAMEQAAQEVQRAGSEAQRQRALERALASLQDARQAMAGAQRSGSDQAQRQGSSGAGRGQASDGADPALARDAASQGGEGTAGDPGAGQSGSGSQAGDASGDQGEGGSSAGTGSLRRRGDSGSGDFLSRQVVVPSSDFDQPQVSAGQQTDEGPIGEAVVDYRQVLPQYRERATEAMAQRYVPPGLKELVRDYFSSLDGRR